MKTCVEPAKRGDSIKPGVERSGTPGSSEPRGNSPRSRREPSQRVSRGFWAIARFARSVSFRSVNLGFRCAPPQALCFYPLRGLGEAGLMSEGMTRREVLKTAVASPLTDKLQE